jgi:DNA-binding GntR family transcriptional regulator
LLEGRYAAGARLSVEDIRLQFGVSKQPVMEAMRRLASDGLVRITPQVGCEVASYEPLEVADFFRLFGSFEAAIAEVAAERRTAQQLEALDEVSRRVEALADVADPVQRVHAYRLLNREFHGVIHEMAQSTIMIEVSQRMWDLSDFLINTTGLAKGMDTGLDRRQQDHDRIRDALAAGDGAAARREMELHIADTLRHSKL